MTPDCQLLESYVRKCAQHAFAELVRRHMNLVYGAAFRVLNRDAHAAEDVAQQVFTELAKKAPSLTTHPSLPAWLYTCACYTASKEVRTLRRRKKREEEALIMQEKTMDQSASWDSLRPLLDETMMELSPEDRESIIQRFFEGSRFSQIGGRLGLSENGARMKVERALAKLGALLASKGIRSSTAALALFVEQELGAVTAPNDLADKIAISAFKNQSARWLGSATAKLAIVGGGLLCAGSLLVFPPGSKPTRKETDNASTTPTLRGDINSTSNLAPTAKLENDDSPSTLTQSKVAAPAIFTAEPVARESDDALPEPLLLSPPEYPQALAHTQTKAEVWVDYIVDAKGQIRVPVISKNSLREFEEAALDALSKTIFKPGRRQAKPVSARMQSVFRFSPESSTQEPPQARTDTD